jgi:predicted DNA-binding transcriptional regulator AlpA
VTADQLTTAEVAALAGIAPASVRRYRLRGTFPEPDGYVGRTPWWRRRTIMRWLAVRPDPGRPRAR